MLSEFSVLTGEPPAPPVNRRKILFLIKIVNIVTMVTKLSQYLFNSILTHACKLLIFGLLKWIGQTENSMFILFFSKIFINTQYMLWIFCRQKKGKKMDTKIWFFCAQCFYFIYFIYIFFNLFFLLSRQKNPPIK